MFFKCNRHNSREHKHEKKNNRQKTETETENRWDPIGEREIPQFSENEYKKYKA